METLEFERVTQEVETCCFDCGVDSINEYVRESYYPMILQHAYALYCKKGKNTWLLSDYV